MDAFVLLYIGSVKSTPVKSVIGQGGPSIVKKVLFYMINLYMNNHCRSFVV